MAMSKEMLESFGSLLYGPSWQNALAKELDVTPRTIQRWLNENHPVPKTAELAMRHMLWRKAKEMMALLEAEHQNWSYKVG